MKNVFYVDVRHLPCQTFINILFYLMLYNIFVFKENMYYVQKSYILHQISFKCVEYDFKMQRFIILNQKQKFYNSPKIADFLAILHFLPKNA